MDLLVHPKDEVGDICVFLLLEVLLEPESAVIAAILILLYKT